MHTCHAANCNQEVKPEMLMCFKHWRMVPSAIQRQVWLHYRSGQCDDWKITHAYAEAARAAVRAVAAKEQQPEGAIREALLVYDALDPENSA